MVAFASFEKFDERIERDKELGHVISPFINTLLLPTKMSKEAALRAASFFLLSIHKLQRRRAKVAGSSSNTNLGAVERLVLGES